VSDLDIQTYIPSHRNRLLRAVRRVAEPAILVDYNADILDLARQTRPDILLAFKAAQLFPETLVKLRMAGVRTYNFYPDTSAFSHGRYLPEALPLYDCVFYTKRHWEASQLTRLNLRASCYLEHGYDPDVHFPVRADDRAALRHEVVFVGGHTAYKEEVLAGLIGRRPDVDLAIWGPYWQTKLRDQRLRRHVRGQAIRGSAYARVLQSAKICLAVMAGPVKGAACGDLTTTRSYEIPACRGFMLHERNAEIAALYQEDDEAVFFDSGEELAEKVGFYLTHPQLRDAIASRGHQRCVPAYSYDARMRQLLAWHRADLRSTSGERLVECLPSSY
jgi:hypothetical protein